MNTENLIMVEPGIGSTYNSFKLTKEEERQIDKDINYFESKADKYGFVTSWCLYEIRALSFKSPFKGKWMTDGIRNEIKIPLPNRRLTGLELWRNADELFHKVSEIKGESNHCFIEYFTQNGDVIEVGFGS
jgi:hypothetical protein